MLDTTKLNAYSVQYCQCWTIFGADEAIVNPAAICRYAARQHHMAAAPSDQVATATMNNISSRAAVG